MTTPLHTLDKLPIVRKTFDTTVKFPADAEDGSIRAVFSTFNVVDREGDVIDPGALKDGTPIKLCSWGHKWDGLPVGKGVIRTTSSEAIFEGKFFLDTEAGRETYLTVKNLDDLQEWSWGFQIKEWERVEKDGRSVRLIKDVEAFEVSPVLIGANQETYTVDIKSAKEDDNTESTAPDGENKESDEVTTEVKEISSDSLDGILDQLGNMVGEIMSADGARSWDCYLLLEAMSLLEWYQGDLRWAEELAELGVDAEEAEIRSALRAHLKRHLSQAKTLKDSGFILVDEENEEQSTATFSDQGDRLLADLDAYLGRTKSLAELRARNNRGWSQGNAERLSGLSAQLRAAADDFQTLLEGTETPAPETVEDETPPAPVKQRNRALDARWELLKRRARTISTTAGDE